MSQGKTKDRPFVYAATAVSVTIAIALLVSFRAYRGTNDTSVSFGFFWIPTGRPLLLDTREILRSTLGFLLIAVTAYLFCYLTTSTLGTKSLQRKLITLIGGSLVLVLLVAAVAMLMDRDLVDEALNGARYVEVEELRLPDKVLLIDREGGRAVVLV